MFKCSAVSVFLGVVIGLGGSLDSGSLSFSDQSSLLVGIRTLHGRSDDEIGSEGDKDDHGDELEDDTGDHDVGGRGGGNTLPG